MEIILRDYQKRAIDSVNENNKKGILVLPTAAGKSICIANIAKKLTGKTLILQPNKEILEQNYNKYCLYNNNAKIFSASLNKKEYGEVVFATIGSIISSEKSKKIINNQFREFKKYIVLDFFKDVKNIIIDECHLVNSQEGLYKEILNIINPEYLIGVTATPYRMRNFRNNKTLEQTVQSWFITRHNNSLFKKILFICQPKELYDNNYLTKIKYINACDNYLNSRIRLNSTGNDYNLESLLKYNKDIDIYGKIFKIIKENKHNHYLIFCSDISEAEFVFEYLNDNNINANIVSSNDSIKNRTKKIEDFRNGYCKVLINCGILTVGFDMPSLDCIILARPLMSLILYQQILGRGIRLYKGKENCYLYDLCNNIKKFGEIENYSIIDTGGLKYRLMCKNKPLTGVNFINMQDLENKTGKIEKNIISLSFGKYKGKNIEEVPSNYLEWVIDNINNSQIKYTINTELKRRYLL